ncbi:MAG: hypothetical protein NVSMB3_08630 [Acidobacteriaceae bacterium]
MLAALTLLASGVLQAQQGVEVTLRLSGVAAGGKAPAAAVWLVPLHGRPLAGTPSPVRRYTLLQKNKMFSPHLLVVPVGAVISFPNADPFFHNVFSLFDGKRFDLGLYEAGSTKEVTFSREGVSYIFCNIHPEMSAVVVSVATPFFSVDDARGMFRIRDVPPGSYAMHVWVEGGEQGALDRMTRTVEVGREGSYLGEVRVPMIARPTTHTNKYGESYEHGESSPYP